MKYRKKPVEIEAMRLGFDRTIDVIEFIGGAASVVPMSQCMDMSIDIETLEGTMRATEGDYIIKGVKGEFYPCKPDIFNMTYDKVGPSL